MKTNQALIENYWTALYTGDVQRLNTLLAPDMETTIIQPDGSRVYFNTSKELIDLDQKISSAIDDVLSTSRTYNFLSPVTQVNFKHQVALKTNDTLQSEGFQNWTTKIVNDLLVLASLVVSEKPVLNTDITRRIAAKV